MIYFFLFIFGLGIGSFLNVVSLRYQPGQRLLDIKIIGGHSRCPNCHKQLFWRELIPIFSFLIQKRKCRACQSKISFQYPLVEILTGLIFVFVPYSLLQLLIFQSFSLSVFQSFIWILIFLLFLLLAIIDFRLYIIPDSINLILAFLGVVLIIFQSFSFSIFQSSFLDHYALLFDLSSSLLSSSIWFNHFFAALIAIIFTGAIIVLSKGRGMGWGDFKLAGVLGLIFGWPDILIIIFLAFIIGAIFIAPLLIKKKKTMKDAVPFGPFLIVSAALVFFFGYQIIDGYFKLFGLY